MPPSLAAALPAIDTLEPRAVWAHFATLCAFPRPSKQEGPLRDHLRRWADGRGLATEVDAAGNLIVRKPGGPGREGAPSLALQAHLDMVCQKRPEIDHDFSRDPIRPVVADDWVRAEGTTLGADNGMGVALILALLEDGDLAHGPLEALFTVDEEAGMGGARGLAPGALRSRRLLNLDTEDWGEFYLGCAGGLDVKVSRRGTAAPLPPGHAVRRITLGGLRGGHSGVDIHEERGNAIKLLAGLLRGLAADRPLRLASLAGGDARNALPREASALVALADDGDLRDRLAAAQASLRQELAGVDEGVTLRDEPATADQVMAPQEQAVWLASLHAAPHGVRRWSRTLPGVVDTSVNLGIVALGPEGGRAEFMVRSLREQGARELGEEIRSLFSLSATPAELSGQYPGWTPNPASPLLARCQAVFRREFGAEAAVKVIHAGLECGLIADKHPGLDVISLGPTIRGAHAPGEAVEIAAVARTWHLLRAIVADLATP